MPVAILRPTGAGALSEWTPSGAATGWEAVSDDLPAGFISANSAGQRDRYTFDDLPADATGVNSFSVYGKCGGSDTAAMRWTVDLAGTESNGATFTPLDGGWVVFSTAFALAPGGVAWTVARANAVTVGPDAVDNSNPDFIIDEAWLYVDYTTSAAAPPQEAETIDMGYRLAVVDRLSDSAVPMPPTSAELAIGGDNPVDIVVQVQTTPVVDFADREGI